MSSNQYAALAELAGGFIHEIKNHLGTLGLNLQLLAEDFADPQNQRERRALQRVERLQSECQRLVDVSNDFLRFARIEDLQCQPEDLSRTIEEMIDFFGPSARAAGIDIKSFIPVDLPRVPLDVDLFKQAILNLLLNAQQAMPDGGLITFQAHVEADREGRQVVNLCIIDTGKGIPSQAIARIFEPFYSTRQGGNGLGLPTTRKIIEAHQGRIDLQSEVGKGTKFSICLPVEAHASCEPSSSSS